MKRCPVCQSLAFDDAVLCYGCLHGFATEEDEESAAAQATVPADERVDAPPAFLIQIKPERGRSGLTSWTCTVDLMPT